jgi:hypothetical protein
MNSSQAIGDYMRRIHGEANNASENEMKMN